MKGSSNVFKSQQVRPQAKKKYENFHTIDWLLDLSKDRFRHRWLLREKERGHLFEKFRQLHDSCSGWVCVLLVAISAGIVAGVVDIGAAWISNIKSGYCTGAFWLNRELCCWSDKNMTLDKYEIPHCANVYF